ncbi:MAG: homoserine dehydrogenase [Tuberibacillus sp.]
MAFNIVLLGFGTVGSAVYQHIKQSHRQLKELIGESVKVTDVVIKDEEKHRTLRSEVNVTTDFLSLIHSKPIDLVIEAIVGIEPAYTYLLQSINNGIPVVTANKALFAHRGASLKKAALSNGVTIGYEATVAGGIPIIHTIQDLLHVNKITKVEGILNGTSNFVLTDMRVHQRSFAESLKIAQAKGYAEADPTNDIQGTDAFYKLVILCETLFGKQPDWRDVSHSGIENIDLDAVLAAETKGERMKLIAEAEVNSLGEITATVVPRRITSEHPLFGVEGVDNAVTLHSDLLGRLTFKGPGAGGSPTASAIIGDLVHILNKNVLSRKEKKRIGA